MDQIRQCECKFCKPTHALRRIAERLASDDDMKSDIADIRAALDSWYEETFELQFDMDCIAAALGIEDAIGVGRIAIMEQIKTRLRVTE